MDTFLSKTESTFVHMVNSNLEFREGLFAALDATDVSTIAHVYGLDLSDSEASTYMNPVRDMPEISLIDDAAKKVGYKIMLVGMDTFGLVERVRDPITYASSDQCKKVLTLCLVVFTNGVSSTIKDYEVMAAVSSTLRTRTRQADTELSMPPHEDDDTVESTGGTVILSYNRPHPYRLIIRVPVDLWHIWFTTEQYPMRFRVGVPLDEPSSFRSANHGWFTTSTEDKNTTLTVSLSDFTSSDIVLLTGRDHNGTEQVWSAIIEVGGDLWTPRYIDAVVNFVLGSTVKAFMFFDECLERSTLKLEVRSSRVMYTSATTYTEL